MRNSYSNLSPKQYYVILRCANAFQTSSNELYITLGGECLEHTNVCLRCLRASFLTRESIRTMPFYGFSFGCSHPGDVSEKLLVTEVVISASSWSSYVLKIEKG